MGGPGGVMERLDRSSAINHLGMVFDCLSLTG
jgi:hypothetical protein